MAATRKAPTTLTPSDLGLNSDDLAPALDLVRLFVPVTDRNVEVIEGDNEEDAGRRLALRLREENLI